VQTVEAVLAFREHKILVLSKKMNTQQKSNEVMMELRLRIHIFPVSTAECERGFSLMNRLLTTQRNRLQIESAK